MMYQKVSAVLEEIDAEISPAEAHGIAVGMLLIEARADVSNWLAALNFNDDADKLQDQESLLELFEETRHALSESSEEFSFDLFLPDTDEPLSLQAEALRDWCQGFLFGVGFTPSASNWPQEINEIMLDIIEFTKLDSDIEEEDDGYALEELREFIRVAVFNIQDYFQEIEPDQSH